MTAYVYDAFLSTGRDIWNIWGKVGTRGRRCLGVDKLSFIYVPGPSFDDNDYKTGIWESTINCIQYNFTLPSVHQLICSNLLNFKQKQIAQFILTISLE